MASLCISPCFSCDPHDMRTYKCHCFKKCLKLCNIWNLLLNLREGLKLSHVTGKASKVKRFSTSDGCNPAEHSEEQVGRTGNVEQGIWFQLEPLLVIQTQKGYSEVYYTCR